MIERTVLREQVKDVLLQRSVRGELTPGERLVETRIASELGTSQAPVREALRDLELLRMVESEPFRGARVRAFGDDELVEVYPVRAALEELAGKLATKRPDGDDLGPQRQGGEKQPRERGGPRAVRQRPAAFARRRAMRPNSSTCFLASRPAAPGFPARIASRMGTCFSAASCGSTYVP